MNIYEIKHRLKHYNQSEEQFLALLSELQSALIKVDREDAVFIQNFLRKQISYINNTNDNLEEKLYLINVKKPLGLKDVVTISVVQNYEDIVKIYTINT